MTRYEEARERYAVLGSNTEQAMEELAKIRISVNCWQGDDVKGFLFRDRDLSGGIQATGQLPGRGAHAAGAAPGYGESLLPHPGQAQGQPALHVCRHGREDRSRRHRAAPL